MKKYLLLTTALATMTAASSALAADTYKISKSAANSNGYSLTNTTTKNVDDYTSLTALIKGIESKGDSKSMTLEDKVKVSDSAVAKSIFSTLVNDSTARKEFALLSAKLTNKDSKIVEQGFNDISKGILSLTSSQQDELLDSLSTADKDWTKVPSDLVSLATNIEYLKIQNDIAKTNPQYQKILDEEAALVKKLRTTATAPKVKTLSADETKQMVDFNNQLIALPSTKDAAAKKLLDEKAPILNAITSTQKARLVAINKELAVLLSSKDATAKKILEDEAAFLSKLDLSTATLSTLSKDNLTKLTEVEKKITTFAGSTDPRVKPLLDERKTLVTTLASTGLTDTQKARLTAINTALVNEFAAIKDPSMLPLINERAALDKKVDDKTITAAEKTRLAAVNKEIADKMKAVDPTILGLLKEEKALLDKLDIDTSAATTTGTLTKEEAARLAVIRKEKYSDPKFVESRNSSAIQENLLAAKEKIEELQKDPVKNQALIEAELKKLNDNLGIYLVENVKDVNQVPDIQKPDTAASEALMSALTARSATDLRLGGFSGVSSGDMFQNYGVWLQGNMTQGTQKAYGNELGYKLNQKAVTIGADAGLASLLGDEGALGLAYTYSANDVKSKNNSATKDDIKSHLFTIYGKAVVSDEVFVNGQFQYGKSDIKKERATGNAANRIIVRGKTKADSLAGKFQVGYNIETAPQAYIVPTIGISYANVDVKGYKESGRAGRSVGKKTTTRTSGLAGISAQYVSEMETMKVIPEVHMNVDYAFSTKNSATIVTVINGIDPIATPSQKLTKALYNAGASVKALQSSMYEISGGYDFGFAKKFQSHTGTVKLRVNL